MYRRVLTLGAATLLLGGCGLEGVFNLYGGNQYTQPVDVIRGATSFTKPTFTVIDAAGNETPVFASSVQDGQYEVQLISGSYTGLRLRAVQGQGIAEAFLPSLKAEEHVDGVDLDVQTTATVKLLEGVVTPLDTTLSALSDDLICITGKKLAVKYGSAGPVADLVALMSKISARANTEVSTETHTFQTAVVRADYTVKTSALNKDWLARANFDYDGDGRPDTTTDAFDAIYVEALKTVELSAPPDPTRVRTVFTVNFNDGRLNGACGAIERFRWVRDEPGRSMFFVGGIHQTSPVQDTQIDAMLGNRGGWTPNQIKMYDDGTHGDQTAGDNIWSISFDLPRGVRIGYKYTWGKQGLLWTGTEEWPGNQRILEVDDVNADGFVVRFDNFGDEASNKDLSNLNPKSGGSLEWNEDLNGDGFPEAREVPGDLDNDCVPDKTFVTPDWVPALTMSCKDFVAN